MAEGDAAAAEQVDIRKNFNYALVRTCDMGEEMRTEVQECATTAVEKNAKNNEGAARMLKETLDKKYGPAWHVVVGEGLGFEVTHETKNMMFMYFGGYTSVLVWKCS